MTRQPEPSQNESQILHRPAAQRVEDAGLWEAVCSCGWRTVWRSPVAARREAKAHRRYPDGNPRLKEGE